MADPSSEGLRPCHPGNETEDLGPSHPGNETEGLLTGHPEVKTSSREGQTADAGRQQDWEEPVSCQETFDGKVRETGSSSQLERVDSRMPEVNTEKPFMCGECGFRTAKKSHLSRHMRTHTGEKPYKCDQCDYSAARKSHLDRHLTKHTEDHLREHAQEKPYMCDKCGYSAATKDELSVHIKTHAT
ncbi:zinc finger protein 37 homolog [Branchiostoma floridae]|uniref:Zinc finger protein 37 homolog n=1 Tax=Branchiostoma floridae TaxID=7739 RepID=A0A9J7HTX2_BRAFL|nr:zinc finger protein 37 homolog [Branchiostoma floridae]